MKLRLFITAVLIAPLVAGSFIIDRITRPRPSLAVVSSPRSEIFHVPSCKWGKKINRDYRREFSNCARAFEEGLRPCKACEHLVIVPKDKFARTDAYMEAWERDNPD